MPRDFLKGCQDYYDVVVIGSDNPQVAAVISQARFADGLAALRSAGPGGSMRLAGAAIGDQLRALRGAEPYRIPVVAAGGQTAPMSQPGSYEGYLDLFSGPGEFRNEYCARVGLGLGFYSPLRSAPGLDCPLLVLTCGADAVTPPAPARRMADRAPLGRNIEYEGAGHFEIYVGELFERTIADQIAFLGESLGAGVDSPAA